MSENLLADVKCKPGQQHRELRWYQYLPGIDGSNAPRGHLLNNEDALRTCTNPRAHPLPKEQCQTQTAANTG
jgi:hypothetical protein